MSSRAVGLFMLLILLICVACSACAALPMPFQPANQQTNSNYAEGGFIVLGSLDASERARCDSKPARAVLVEVATMTVHTMVTSWLDDEVAAHGNAGGWYASRVVWHGASLLAAGGSVVHNRLEGCSL